MASQAHSEKKGSAEGEGFKEHIGYSARQLRGKIHAPIRATQFGGDRTGRFLERVQQGGWEDHLAIAVELFQAKELDEVFANTKAAAALIQHVPMMKLIKGMPELAAKGEAITPADVSYDEWACGIYIYIYHGLGSHERRKTENYMLVLCG